MGASAPGGLERDAGVLAGRAPAEKAGPLAAAITRLHSGFFRSRLAGQANAILIDRSLPTTQLSGVQISEEGRERRVVHAVRIDQLGVVANLHASNAVPDVVVRELVRARAFVDTRAAPDEARILAGDFNLAHPALAGYENGGPGLDHILGRERGSDAARQLARRATGRRLARALGPCTRSSASSDRLRAVAREPTVMTLGSGRPYDERGAASAHAGRLPSAPWKPTASQPSPAGSGSSPSTSTASARRRSGSGSGRARATSRLPRPASPTSSSTCSSRARSATTR